MNKSKEIIDLLNKHYIKNLELGIFYNILNVKAQKFNMPNLSKYIKQLSDDKLTIHKDKITDYLSSIGADLDPSLIKNYSEELKQINSAKEIIEKIYYEENLIRQEVSEFASACIKDSDFESFEFIQWFIKDGLKDFGEIEYIDGLFKNTKDLVLIDMNIEKII